METRGGNSIQIGSSNLHAEWDQVLGSLNPHRIEQKVLARAQAIPTTNAPAEKWTEIWASDTLGAARTACTGISHMRRGKAGTWSARFDDRKKYLAMKRDVQNQQLIKAGARLAQPLNFALAESVTNSESVIRSQ
jgi:hypothetical protein